METTNSDIKLDVGNNFILLIDTDQYSGNFEREMAGFTCGSFDPDGYRGEQQYQDFVEAAATNPILNSILEKIDARSHEEYDQVTHVIWPTPGRFNNGTGGHFDDFPDYLGQKYPAYETVAVFLSSPLTTQELEVVRDRAQRYGAARINFRDQPDPIVIKNVRQINIVVGQTITVVE